MKSKRILFFIPIIIIICLFNSIQFINLSLNPIKSTEPIPINWNNGLIIDHTCTNISKIPDFQFEEIS